MMENTIIACLTPPGRAGVATLGLRGPTAWDLAREFFQPVGGKLPEQPITKKFWYGKIGITHADSAILAAKSEWPICVEIHCHGGMEVVRFVQDLFVQRGAVAVSWQQYFGDSNGLLEMLANAPTLRTAAVLLDQVSGAWERATAEANPETRNRLRELIPLGNHLVEPWRVVLAGAPNVGKSSLMNALAGYTRSVVTPIPGTTRDLVACRLAIDGWPVELIDTAGVRDSRETLEQIGINQARAAAADADLRVWVVDGSAEPILPSEPSEWLLIINKTDLPPAWDWDSLPNTLRVSAQTGDGIAPLCDAIARALVPAPPLPGEAVPCTEHQREWCAVQ